MVVLVSGAHRCGHQRDGVRGLARPRWSSHNELFGFCVIGDIGEGTSACLKDAPSDFAVDASGELTRLAADAFDFGDRLGMSGSQAFFAGERSRCRIFTLRGRPLLMAGFVQSFDQFFQFQLLSEHL
jgi:hypothetical protein